MSDSLGIAGDTFVRYLGKVIEGAASGSGADSECETICPDRPRDRFFIGRLAPQRSTDDDTLENDEDFYSRLDPNAIRMRFLVQKKSETSVVISPGFHYYVRVFPEPEVQNRYSES